MGSETEGPTLGSALQNRGCDLALTLVFGIGNH